MDDRTRDTRATDFAEYPGAPRWAKAFGIAGLILLFAFAIVHLTGHGFGHHGSRGAHSQPREDHLEAPADGFVGDR